MMLLHTIHHTQVYCGKLDFLALQAFSRLTLGISGSLFMVSDHKGKDFFLSYTEKSHK